jgi:spermidine/putrescine transport system ATP-binding protein
MTEAVGIALRGVSKRYGAAVALEPTDMEIREGEFMCLLGPSGCGKTTTLNLIGGFVAPTTGEIHIRGQRVDRVPPHRRAVNTVFQSYALFPHMTVRDNVGFGLKMARVGKQESRERVAESLRLVDLEEFAERLPTQLSGGQQQRVAVARALVNRPAVLLLDEPLGALDLKLRKRLQIELSQIHREIGTTFVLVTHDQEEAMGMGERIAVMADGRVEQIGTPEQIYRRPSSRFVADFIGESNFIDVRRGEGGALGPGDVRLPVPSDNGWSEATLMVRPEQIAVGRDGDGLPATVVQTAFLGSHLRVTTAVAGMEAPVTAWLHGGDAAAFRAQPGDPVALSWNAEDAVILDRENRTTHEGGADE